MSQIRALRKAAGFSQVQLAHRANVSRFRLSLAETEGFELSEAELISIRAVLSPALQENARLVSEFQAANSVAESA